MRQRLAVIVILITSFLVAVLILSPASALSPWVERLSSGHWQLASTEGSIWSGSGTLLARSGDKTWHVAQNIRWQLRWGNLWRGRIDVVATLEQGSLLLAVTSKRLSFEQLDASIPAPLLLELLPGALGRYGWGGFIHLGSNTFSCNWNSYSCVGEIELTWRDAEVAEIPGNKLGDYRFRIVGESQALRIDLTTLSGRLQFNGSGEISPHGLRFNGEAAAMGPNAANLGAMLNTLGRRSRTPGKYLIDYREASTGQ